MPKYKILDSSGATPNQPLDYSKHVYAWRRLAKNDAY